eukprot:TRINITY_DN7013_c0_g1_i5.p1 TRINITY_DN7013_c0_g1~~TRINITY_DN7013_c0_g1_i5.p1  ORF type:complete len:112 (+),score=17.27 TRINITY_DN7013_c0_g1_i5:59-394(+)
MMTSTSIARPAFTNENPDSHVENVTVECSVDMNLKSIGKPHRKGRNKCEDLLAQDASQQELSGIKAHGFRYRRLGKFLHDEVGMMRGDLVDHVRDVAHIVRFLELDTGNIT